MQIAKSLAGFSPAEADDLRKAIGKKSVELMASLKDRFIEGCVANAVPKPTRRAAVGRERALGRLLVQQVARRLLRADLLPHRLPEGQLPGGVHGGADLVRHGHEGQGPVLRRRVRRHGHRGAAAGRQLVAARLRGGARARCGSACPRSRTWGRTRCGRSSRRAAPTGRSTPSGTSASASTCSRCPRACSTAWSSGRVRLHRRAAQGPRRGGRAGDRVGPQVAGRPARRAGLDLRPRAGLRPAGDHVVPGHPRHRVRQARAAAGRARHARAVRLEPPAGRRPRPAAAARSTAASASSPGGARATASWSVASSRRCAST